MRDYEVSSGYFSGSLTILDDDRIIGSVQDTIVGDIRPEKGLTKFIIGQKEGSRIAFLEICADRDRSCVIHVVYEVSPDFYKGRWCPVDISIVDKTRKFSKGSSFRQIGRALKARNTSKSLELLSKIEREKMTPYLIDKILSTITKKGAEGYLSLCPISSFSA